VPEDFDVNYDEVLRGCDQGTEKSLNGPRVTEMLTRLVPNYDAFLAVVRQRAVVVPFACARGT